MYDFFQNLVRLEDRQIGVLDIFELSPNEMGVSLQRFLSVVERINHFIGDLELVGIVEVILIGGLFEREESSVDFIPRDKDPKQRKGERKIDDDLDSKTQLHIHSITDEKKDEKLPDIQ